MKNTVTKGDPLSRSMGHYGKGPALRARRLAGYPVASAREADPAAAPVQMRPDTMAGLAPGKMGTAGARPATTR